jgi:hypothetical protein
MDAIEETFKNVELDFFDENKLRQSIIGTRLPKQNMDSIIREFFRVQCMILMAFLSEFTDEETSNKLLESSNRIIREEITPEQVEPELKALVNAIVLDEIKNKKNRRLMAMSIQLTMHYAQKFEEYF